MLLAAQCSMDAVPPWQSSTLTPTRTYGSRYPGAELQLHEQQPEERAEERAERLAEAGGRRLHRLPPTTEKVWLKHSWKLSDGAQWDAALLQYAGRERCDANVDGTHTRAEWHDGGRRSDGREQGRPGPARSRRGAFFRFSDPTPRVGKPAPGRR